MECPLRLWLSRHSLSTLTCRPDSRRFHATTAPNLRSLISESSKRSGHLEPGRFLAARAKSVGYIVNCVLCEIWRTSVMGPISSTFNSSQQQEVRGPREPHGEARSGSHDGFHQRPVRHWIPALLLLLFVAQSLWFIGTQSLTFDEPGHIYAGLDAWQHGRFEMWVDHPPLGRYWLTLPIALARIQIVQQSPNDRHYRVTAMQPGPEWIAWRTRPMNVLLGIALGLTLWFATRQLFSEGAANVTLALFAFTPSFIAHYSLATTDGIGALFIFLTAWQLVLWRRNPGRRQTILMGVVLAGLLLSKLYTPPEALLALILMLVLGRDGILKRPGAWHWKEMFTAFGIALLIFWAGYLFHISRLEVGHERVVMTFPNRPVKTLARASKAQFNLFLPAGEYAEGLRLVALSGRNGRETYFLGKEYPNGAPRYYFPVVIALKWPPVLLLLCVASLLLGVRKTCRAPGDLLIICCFGLVFLVLALFSRITIGERHVLPLYAFALLIAGGIWEHVRRYRFAIGVLVLALCLNAADALRYAPDYLAYFSVFIPRNNGWHLLTDSNVDWGQGLIALRAYQQQHPNEELHVAYFGSIAPDLYGVRVTQLAPDEHVKGTIVAGASCLAGSLCGGYDGYSWLRNYEPRRVLDHSMFVFDATK